MGEYDDLIAHAKTLPAKEDYSDLIAHAAALPGYPAKVQTDLPADVRAPEPEKGFFGRQFDRLKSGVHTVVDSLNDDSLDNALKHPIESFMNPAIRREAERGIADALPIPEAVTHALIGKTEQSDAAAAPGIRPGAGVLASLLPNPVSEFTGGLSGQLMKDIPVGGVVTGAAKGLAKSVLGHEMAVVPQAAGSAIMHRENPLPVIQQAATDPTGLAVAGLGGAVGGAGEGEAASIRNPKVLSGRTIAAIEGAGGRTRMLGKNPVTGGLYDSPELTSLQSGRAGVNELGDNAQSRIVDYNRAKLERARADFGQQSDAILAQHGPTKYDFSPLHQKFDDLEKEITASNGAIVDPELKKAIDQVRGATTQVVPTRPGQPPIVIPAGTVSDLLKAQKVVKAQAGYGGIPTAENRPYRILDGLLASEGGDIDPRLAGIRKQYGNTMESLKQANRILFNSNTPDIPESAAKERGAALRLGRIGDETQAATGASARQLEDLRSLDPEYDRQLQLLAAKKAAERIRYGDPEVSMPIEQGMNRAAKGGILPVAAAGLGFKFLGPLGAVLGAATGPFLQNPLALKLRMGLPAAEAVGRRFGTPLGAPIRPLLATDLKGRIGGLPSSSVENVLTRAARQKRQKDAEASRILSGNMP